MLEATRHAEIALCTSRPLLCFDWDTDLSRWKNSYLGWLRCPAEWEVSFTRHWSSILIWNLHQSRKKKVRSRPPRPPQLSSVSQTHFLWIPFLEKVEKILEKTVRIHFWCVRISFFCACVCKEYTFLKILSFDLLQLLSYQNDVVTLRQWEI